MPVADIYLKRRKPAPRAVFCPRCDRELPRDLAEGAREDHAHGQPWEEAITSACGCPRYDEHGEAVEGSEG